MPGSTRRICGKSASRGKYNVAGGFLLGQNIAKAKIIRFAALLVRLKGLHPSYITGLPLKTRCNLTFRGLQQGDRCSFWKYQPQPGQLHERDNYTFYGRIPL